MTFLNDFSIDEVTDRTIQIFKYREQLTKIAHREQTALTIELDDVKKFQDDGDAYETLATCIANNTKRYINMMLEVSTRSLLLLYILKIIWDFSTVGARNFA